MRRRNWESERALNWDNLSPQERRAMQNEKLRRFIAEKVYPCHPHYRRVFDENGIDPDAIRTVTDLERIPFTYKEDIAPCESDPEVPLKFVMQPTPLDDLLDGSSFAEGLIAWHRLKGLHPSRIWELKEEYEPVITMFTTGRTAEPTPFFLTLHDVRRMCEAGRRLLAVAMTGLDKVSDDGLLAINNFPGHTHLGYWMALTVGFGVPVNVVSTGGGTTLGQELILNIIERMRASIFMGLPGYTYDLLKKAASEGRDLSSLALVLMGGDRITERTREKVTYLLEELGSVDPVVTGVYGCTEMKYAWGDCGIDPDSGYHTYPDMEIIEIVEPETGTILGEGETGELVITNLDARGSVVLRYRTGDIVQGGYTTEPCPGCGRRTVRISGNISRARKHKEFYLSKVKGNLVDLNGFSAVLNNVDVLEWCVEIKKRNDDPDDIDEIVIYVCPTYIGNEEGLDKRIIDEIKNTMDLVPDSVVVAPYDEIVARVESGGKAVRVKDLRPK